MDAKRFDAIVRNLGAGGSRRRVVAGFLAGTLAGVLGGPATAKPAQRKRSRKPSNAKNAKGRTKTNERGKARQSQQRRPNPRPAPSQRECVQFCAEIFPRPGRQRARCIAAAARGAGPCANCAEDPARYCGGACVDIDGDVDNCGACGEQCPASACEQPICSGGHCDRQSIADCCTSDDDCDSGDACTVDVCQNNRCQPQPIASCCRGDGDCAPCERCADDTCIPDRRQDGASCNAGDGGVCCDGACMPCGEDETVDLDSCMCGTTGCVCTRVGLGEPCAHHIDCCSGLCVGAEEDGQGRCTDSRDVFESPYCVPEGAFCLNENDIPGLNLCCSGVCTDCACVGDAPVCRELGDPDCASGCCGSAVCAPGGCCLDRGDACSANGECCSRSCEDLNENGNPFCACGAVGTPCARPTQCCSEVCGPDGVCACSQPEDSTLPCREDADCCGGRCRHGMQAPMHGADGLCCRLADQYCEFDFECCSGSCDEARSACN